MNQVLIKPIRSSPFTDGSSVIIYAAEIDENEDWWRGQYRAIYLLNLDE